MARKILLADDSVTAQNMGRKILADAGYDVITVNNGSAALKRVTESKPDLIVLDVYMPGYSGLEVCQRIKDAPETAHIPVLLTVGKLEPFKPDEARRARADAHIVKPFEASELLSAIARLEDRMVPTTNGPRFAASVSGVERFSDERPKAAPPDSDTGWKSRLRFPSRKKKEEPEPEEDSASSFRDFRKGKGKSAGNGALASSAPPPGQEPGLVPDIPRDITPEELDALSALAAKLDGPIPEAENIASLAERVGPPQPEAAVPPSNAAAAEPATPAPSESKDFEVPPAAIQAAAAITAQVISASEPDASPLEAVSNSQPAIPENSDYGSEKFAAFTVNPAVLAEPPAPIDQSDEPIFAVIPAASSEPEAASPSLADAVAFEPATPAPQMASESNAPEVSAAPQPEAEKLEPENLESAITEPAIAESVEAQSPSDQSAVEVSAASQLVPQSIVESPAKYQPADAPAPTDEELAEALRLLTPATANAEISTPSHGTLVAAGQMLAEEVARTSASPARWVAEVVALSPEESSASLEEEMLHSFGSAAANTDSQPTAFSATSESGTPDTTSKELPSATSIGGPVSKSDPAPFSNVDSGIASAPASDSTAYSDEPATGKTEESIDEPAAEMAEEPMHGTFADATLQSEESAVGSSEESPVESTNCESPVESAQTVVAGASVDENSSSDLGGDHDMAKHGKENSTKSGWHQIRKPAASSAPADVVEAAKQSDSSAKDAKEDSRAMAAAATAEGGSAAPDASAIASIVDSVLADLRPKIVEEIAKKLGKK